MKQYTDEQVLLELSRRRFPQQILQFSAKYPDVMFEQVMRLYSEKSEKDENQIVNGLFLIAWIAKKVMKMDYYKSYYTLVQQYRNHNSKYIQQIVKEHIEALRNLQHRNMIQNILSEDDLYVY